MSGEVKMKRRDRTVFRAAALAAFLLIMSTVILLSVRADLDYGCLLYTSPSPRD